VDAAHRIDHGHFAGSEEAFRHWDEDDPAVVSGQCSKCHTAEGLPLFLAEGVAITQAPSNGLLCSTCHDDLSAWTRFEAASVEFPSGAVLSTDDLDANLCMNCHQGRSSTASVAAAIAGLDPDAVSADLRFINIHYFAAGATLFGDEAMGGYQYSGNEYVGRTVHVEAFDTCTECHGAHTLDVRVESCAACHGDAPLTAIRITEGDFDGDGDASEGIHGEIDTMRDLLLTQIQAYAASIEGADPIIYDSHAYPYFFIDSDGDGAVSPGEGIYPNRYVTWTPRLLAATYNYQYAQKDTGGYAHGPMYVLQLLYDSFQDLGGDTTGMIRP
jgi:hypothetical protein